MKLLQRAWGLIPFAVLLLAGGLRVADPPIIERLRLATFDEYLRLQPRIWEDADVRIVDIDDASLEKLGQWPWQRTLLGSLTERLTAMGAAAVAFDFIFPEPDRSSPARVLPAWAALAGDPSLIELARRLPDHDAYFADALRDAPSILGFMLTEQMAARRPAVKSSLAIAGDDPRPFLRAFPGAVSDLPELEQAASGLGSINSATDRDGINRRVPLFVRLQGGQTVTDEIYPTLAAEALRVAQQAPTYVLRISGASGASAFGESTGFETVRIGGLTAPTDDQGQLWIYDTGYAPQRYIPAWRVLERDFDPAGVEGKIIFIGTSAAGLKDIRATPLNPAAAGVELHAQAAEQMILGQFLERPDWMTGAELAWLVALGLALVVLLPRWGAVWCAVVAAAGISLTFASSWFAFTGPGWLVDPIYPSLAALLLYLMQSFLLFLRTESERRHVRGAFGRYMSPALVERLARDPASLRLGGEIRDMTLMFCDIRGFTAISESMDAESLTRFLNQFLTPMTDIILSHRGTIDKYMGDAIMAFWNAPLEDPEHAVNAARAVLDMIARLEVLNAVWRGESEEGGVVYPRLAIGIGLNSGFCCVGNMGSEQRFDYSVIGDTVNLASRLEGQSKNYGVPIVIGPATRASLRQFATLELDQIMVKGKAESVTIHALLGDEAIAAAPWFRAAEATQREMLAAYRRRDWPRTGRALDDLRRVSEDRLTILCDLYAERVTEFERNPPPSDWDGVYRATEK